jgi:hypothetical protein
MKNPPEQYEELRIPWTIADEAISRGYDYAEVMVKQVNELRADGVTLRSIIKQAYQEGFLAGVAYRLTGGTND